MTDEKLVQESWFSEDNGYRIMTNEATYIYAFKKGLKAGRVSQWHKVADGDLPPLRKEVLWRVDKQLWLGELLESRIDFGEWELDSVLFNDYEITWKEIELPEEGDCISRGSC